MGSTFGAFGGQEAAKMSSKIDAKIGIEKSSFRGGPSNSEHPWLVAGGVPPFKGSYTSPDSVRHGPNFPGAALLRLVASFSFPLCLLGDLLEQPVSASFLLHVFFVPFPVFHEILDAMLASF